MGRRTAALLCVLFVHALVLFFLLRMSPPAERHAAEFETEAITLFLEPLPAETPRRPAPERAPAATPRKPAATAAQSAPAASAAEPGSITLPGRVDWPLEGKKSATKVLAAEAEAERIARMFSGPGGTWASLTARERSRLKKFRWKPGIDGLEYDEHGNAIYHVGEGCVVVNLMFIGCALGKAKVHGDLFDQMRDYFDERRLPPVDNGNGTER
jgi:hypothetical protein